MGLKMTQEEAKFNPGLRRHLKACGWVMPAKRNEQQKKRWHDWYQMARLGRIFYG